MGGSGPGPRIYFGPSHRLHHGAAGLLLTAVGGLLCWHDRKDVRRWLADVFFCRDRLL